MIVELMSAAAILTGALHTADAFWASAGQPVKCAPLYEVYDEPDPEVLAHAGIGWCGGLGFDRDFVDELARVHRQEPWLARENLTLACVVAIHERAHELSPYGFLGIDGQGHEAHGVLQADVDKIDPPGACVDWARRLTKLPRHKRSRVKIHELTLPGRS